MRSIVFLGLLHVLAVHGQPPAGYYDAAQGLQGPALRQALHGIIADHTVQPNSSLWAAFAACDARPDGTVWDIYSDVPGGTPAYVFHFGVDQCGSYNSEGDCFNREHSFPQSWYGDGAPMSTDLFHIYPTDGWVNAQRGNLAYGKVNSPNWTSTNGSRRGPCAWPGCSGTVFEPIDAYKGDVARSILYMATRYLPNLNNWGGPMMAGGDLAPWALQLLRQWHADDPVSPKEVDRNNCIHGLQGNRNPYIDQPEWVEAIWGDPVGVGATADHNALRLWYHNGRISWSSDATTGPVRLYVADITGRAVPVESTHAASVGVEHLPAGVYVAVVENGSARQVLRFVH